MRQRSSKELVAIIQNYKEQLKRANSTIIEQKHKHLEKRGDAFLLGFAMAFVLLGALTVALKMVFG